MAVIANIIFGYVLLITGELKMLAIILSDKIICSQSCAVNFRELNDSVFA